MESKKIIIIAILLGLLGMFLSFYYLRKKEAALLYGMQLQSVLVASKDIPPKTRITANLLKVEKIPERYMLPKAIIVNTQDDIKQVINKITVAPLAAGQQISMTEIVPPTEETGLSVNIPPNMRAMIVQINNIDVIDLVKPNDRVDVITIFSAQHATKGKVKIASTILQDILVLGVSKDLGVIEEDPDSFKKKKKENEGSTKTMNMMTVSLALLPEQVQVLALAQNQGDIVLSIRANNDSEVRKNLSPIDSTVFLS